MEVLNDDIILDESSVTTDTYEDWSVTAEGTSAIAKDNSQKIEEATEKESSSTFVIKLNDKGEDYESYEAACNTVEAACKAIIGGNKNVEIEYQSQVGLVLIRYKYFDSIVEYFNGVLTYGVFIFNGDALQYNQIITPSAYSLYISYLGTNDITINNKTDLDSYGQGEKISYPNKMFGTLSRSINRSSNEVEYTREEMKTKIYVALSDTKKKFQGPYQTTPIYNIFSWYDAPDDQMTVGITDTKVHVIYDPEIGLGDECQSDCYFLEGEISIDDIKYSESGQDPSDIYKYLTINGLKVKALKRDFTYVDIRGDIYVDVEFSQHPNGKESCSVYTMYVKDNNIRVNYDAINKVEDVSRYTDSNNENFYFLEGNATPEATDYITRNNLTKQETFKGYTFMPSDNSNWLTSGDGGVDFFRDIDIETNFFLSIKTEIQSSHIYTGESITGTISAPYIDNLYISRVSPFVTINAVTINASTYAVVNTKINGITELISRGLFNCNIIGIDYFDLTTDNEYPTIVLNSALINYNILIGDKDLQSDPENNLKFIEAAGSPTVHKNATYYTLNTTALSNNTIVYP